LKIFTGRELRTEAVAEAQTGVANSRGEKLVMRSALERETRNMAARIILPLLVRRPTTPK
jgi:hypothetical protein